MNCLIIDDEPLAHNVIKRYCENLPHIQIIGSSHTALEALEFLSSHSADLIFLDINMPKLKGLDFLRTLPDPPLVIVTTAYQEFALESYELSVCDYLLKPFSLERFLKAINKAQNWKALQDKATIAQPSPVTVTSDDSGTSDQTLFLKGDKKIHQVRFDQILYLESYGSYVRFHLDNEMVMTLERLATFESSLPADAFIRVHKSYIVSVKKIDVIEGNTIHLKGQKIPIGKVYKHNLDKVLKA
ncbi:MAG: LytTR family DNA-binding domain-containing protein [Bacteroidota bacterium]